MKTCRRIIPPAPGATEETIVLKKNMTDRVPGETKEYIIKSCNKKGITKKNNITKD